MLQGSGRTTAANEIHEALRDISRRPVPDRTGAIQHAIAALECTARDITGEPNATLGALVPKLDLPSPLDTAVNKLWGFASDRARHLREGKSADGAEAELVVSIACAVCTFLAKPSTGRVAAGARRPAPGLRAARRRRGALRPQRTRKAPAITTSRSHLPRKSCMMPPCRGTVYGEQASSCPLEPGYKETNILRSGS